MVKKVVKRKDAGISSSVLLGAAGIAVLSLAIYAVVLDLKFAPETCHKDSRKDKGQVSCSIVDEGKTLPFAIQIEIYGATKEELIKARKLAFSQLESDLPEAVIIGADLNKYGYKINTFMNVPKEKEGEKPFALPAPAESSKKLKPTTEKKKK